MKIIYAILLLSFLQVPVCNIEVDVPRNTTKFSQLLIPVWVSLQLEDYEKAGRYAEQFFDLYEPEFIDQADYDEVWTKHLYEDISELESTISLGNYEEAMDITNCLMNHMSLWHKATGQEYYFDKIWDFAQRYQELNLVINNFYLCHYEWNTVEQFIEELNKSWAILESTPVNLYGFDFDESPDYSSIEEHKRNISLCLQEFNSQLVDADRGVLANRCNEIQPNLIKLVSLFGQFRMGKAFLS